MPRTVTQEVASLALVRVGQEHVDDVIDHVLNVDNTRHCQNIFALSIANSLVTAKRQIYHLRKQNNVPVNRATMTFFSGHKNIQKASPTMFAGIKTE